MSTVKPAPQSVPGPKPNDAARSALDAITAREHRWASRSGVALDLAGCLVDAVDGLCFAPTDEQKARLDRHPDRPLGAPGKPAPIGEPGAAWGLACNLIEPIETDSLCDLLRAIGAAGRAVRRSYVHPMPDQMGGAIAPPLVQIDRENAGPVFVEVLGAELATHASDHATSLPRPEAGWGDLEGCRRLASERGRGFESIPIARLLRRMRTLSHGHGRRGFRYVVVRPLFDARFDDALRRAFDGMRMRIGGEVDFDAIDVATLHARLAAADPGAHPALGWLADRYLDGEAAAAGARALTNA